MNKRITLFLITLLTVCGVQSQNNNQNRNADFHKWAETPPMGWNSWDCFGANVTEAEVKTNADYMAEHLKDYGWEYIVVDIRWFVENQTTGYYNFKDPKYVLDEYGRYMPAVNRFPSAGNGNGFKPLADYVHSKGLKFGIHLMRGVPTLAVEKKLPVKDAGGVTAADIYSTDWKCPWLGDNYTIVADKPGAQDYYNSIFDLYASWGVDFVKIDDLSRPYHQAEIEMIRKAIDRTGRPIVLSMSPGETDVNKADHAVGHANMWRTVDDFWDNWPHLYHQFEVCPKWAPYIGRGAWPDADMLPLGHIDLRGNARMSKFTRDEQYMVMTLFAMFKSPLMFGGHLPDNDKFTNSLITNEEVLYVHRNSVNNKQWYNKDGVIAWTADDPRNGDKYLALFYVDQKEPRESHPANRKVTVDLKELGFGGAAKVRDIWRNQDLGNFSGTEFSPVINYHGAGLYRISKKLKVQTNNPIIQTKYTADPAPMVHNDTVFLYSSHDDDNAKGFVMREWLLYTSTDMVNWTDHGVVASLKDFKWVPYDNGAWAPQCIERNGKFYMYCPMPGGIGIGVLVADSPYGPFIDPIGKPLVKNSYADIDPTVLIDDDGQAYMYWGNPDLYYVKLNEDMISCDGEVVHEQMTHEAFGERKGNQKRPTLYEEGPWAYKRKNKYYMAFASTCCPEGMGYSMSDSPTGPWVYKGMIMEGDRRSNGNHPGIIDYKGNTYVFGFNYDIHFSKISQHYERRSICVEKLTFNPDGTIQQLPFWTAKGVDPVGKLDPYRRIEAETIAWSEGLKTEKSEAGMYVTAIHDGDYIRVRNVDFKKGAKSFEAVAASSSSGGQIEIRLDDKEGTLIGTCVIGNTGGPESWKTFQAQVDKVKGVHDVYFIFRGGEDELFNFDCWKFIR